MTTKNQARILAACPKGTTVLRRACEAAGFDPRKVLLDPSDEQTDAIIDEIKAMTADGTVARETAINLARAANPDTHGDGGRYVRGHTWGDELGAIEDPDLSRPGAE